MLNLTLLSSIIIQSFQSQHCTYFIGNDDIVAKAIIQSEISVMISTVNNLICKPTGYIVAYEDAHNVSIQFSNIYSFIPHKRILIFCHTCKDLYKLKLKSKLHALDVLIIDVNNAKMLTIGPYKKWIPYFGNNTVKAIIFDCKPYTFYNIDGKMVGLEKNILDEVMKSWPVEYVIYPKFSWDTAVKAVFDFKANITAAGYWWLYGIKQRYFLDVSQPYTQIVSTMLVPKPNILPDETFVFQAMSTRIWLMVIGTTIIVGFIMYLMSRLDQAASNHGVIIYILNVISLLSANSEQIRSNWLNIVTLYWSLMSVLLITAYSAGFSAVNTTPRYEKQINNFEDVLESNIKCYESSKTISAMFNLSSNKLFNELASRIHIDYYLDLPKGACTPAEIIGNRYVFTEVQLGKNKHTFRVLDDYFAYMNLIIYLNGNSPYTLIFDEKIKMLMEHGFIKVWFEMAKLMDFNNIVGMVSFYTIESVMGETDAKPLTVMKMQGAFYLLFAGLIISCVAYVGEILNNKKILLKFTN